MLEQCNVEKQVVTAMGGRKVPDSFQGIMDFRGWGGGGGGTEDPFWKLLCCCCFVVCGCMVLPPLILCPFHPLLYGIMWLAKH